MNLSASRTLLADEQAGEARAGNNMVTDEASGEFGPSADHQSCVSVVIGSGRLDAAPSRSEGHRSAASAPRRLGALEECGRALGQGSEAAVPVERHAVAVCKHGAAPVVE
jgi:hypothetical protein